MNTFYVNYMTKTFSTFAGSGYGVRRNGKGIADAIAEAAKRAGNADEAADTAGAGGVMPESSAAYSARRTNDRIEASNIRDAGEDQSSRTGSLNEFCPLDHAVIESMTMDEYKEYIRERILSIPMHASHRQDTISITISDEGLAAMKRDADYEEWVLNDLRCGWAWENPWARYLGGAYSVIHYGATKEECHAEMWNAGFRHGDGKGLFESMSGDEDDDDKRRKSEIIVKPDGTRYLVISEVIGGMKVTVMSVKLTEADELLQDTPDLENSAAGQALAEGGSSPI